MKIEIKNRWTGSVLFEVDIGSSKLAVEAAVKGGADLRRADLHGADLREADLRGADLLGANLHEADLHGADLRGADLREADLHGADLHEADLRGADLHGADLEKGKTKIDWESHNLVAEILRRAAGDDIEKLKIAGLVLLCRDWCWNQFSKIDDPLKQWAFDVLHPWVIGGENAPDVLKPIEAKSIT